MKNDMGSSGFTGAGPTFASLWPGWRDDMSKTDTIARMHSVGTLHRVLADGSEVSMPNPGPIPPMTEEEFQRARKMPRAKTLRRALGLTQEEFAARHHIPIGTLRDWEQGRCEPDQPARLSLCHRA